VRIIVILLIIGLALCSKAAYAGIVVMWELPARKMHFKVEYENAENVRMSIEDNLYLLVRGSNIYVINEGSVTDVNAFRDKIKDWAIVRFLADRMDARSKKIPAPGTLKATGRTEVVAGIQGDVYHTEITDPESGKKEQRDIVLTTDIRLVKLKQSMQEISDRNMRTFHNHGFTHMRDSFNQSFPPDVAILRYDTKFYVASVTEKTLAPERFQLPEGSEIKDLPSLSDLSTFIRLATPFAY